MYLDSPHKLTMEYRETSQYTRIHSNTSVLVLREYLPEIWHTFRIEIPKQ